MSRAWRALRVAFSLLTIVPVPLRPEETDDASLADARLAFPVVGLAIGLALALVSEALAGSPPPVVAFVLVAAGAIVTGGLHLDGLADTADGLFLSGGPERRLDVMRDPHAGAFGVAAIVLVLLGKLAALASLPGAGHARSLAIVAAVAIGRMLMLVAAGLARYARAEGTGRVVVEATSSEEGLATAAGVVLAGLALGRWAGLLASLAALGLTWGLTRLCRTRLGGLTGDTLGALVELGELAILVILGLLQPIPAK